MPTVKGELGWVPSESCEGETVPGPSPGFWGFAGELGVSGCTGASAWSLSHLIKSFALGAPLCQFVSLHRDTKHNGLGLTLRTSS